MRKSDYESAKQMNLAASKCMQREDYNGALEYFSKALKFLPENMLTAKAELRSNRGHALVSIQSYEEALSSFIDAAEIFQQLGDKIGLGEQLGNIGSVQRDMEKWNDSLDAYFKALAIFKEIGHKEKIANQYSNIAYSYSRKGELKNAFQFFGEAKALYEELEEHSKVQLCDQNLQAIKPYLKE